MKDAVLNILVLVVILGASAVITRLFAQAMYIKCTACGTLNAKRRTNCRSCQTQLR